MLKKNQVKVGLLCVVSSFILCGMGWAQKAEADPTTITADRVTFDYDHHYGLFEKNVVVLDAQIKIKCDNMTVRLNKDHKIFKVLAVGNVFIEQEDTTALAGQATYEVASGEIILSDNPSLRRGKNVLRGEKITFYRDSNKIKSEGSPTLSIKPEKGKSPLER